jgi:hypothetical protein
MAGYDRSNVPASRRGKVLVVWYNETLNDEVPTTLTHPVIDRILQA